jgi:ubiquinone/menaquinone biosynthesis C-methylase UbiE
MPVKDSSLDYIYRSRVIENFNDYNHIIKQSYIILKPRGVSFSTVPAFNLWWVFRYFNNIPDIYILRQVLEFIHLDILKGKILEKYYGYELSFTAKKLKYLHQKNSFKEVFVSGFPAHPSKKKSIHPLLDILYSISQGNIFTGAVCQVYGRK